MNKMNKKGFTLIEMLVVIAIIAVLVSIIIPTVSSATTKAAAAADAANLRSILAEATTDLLNGADNDEGYVHYTASSKTFDVQDTAPKSKSLETETPATVYMDGDQICVRYGDYTLDAFQLVAENGGDLEADYKAPAVDPEG